MANGTSISPTEENLIIISAIAGSMDSKEEVRAHGGNRVNSSLFEFSEIPFISAMELVKGSTTFPPIMSTNVNHTTCSARKMEGDKFFGIV
jgi:hypothetical protein